MNVLYQLVLRNLRLFLRDKAAVFFSLLSVIIILGMYILFLGKMQSDNIAELVPGDDGPWLIATWIMAGILTVSTVTVPVSAVGNLIDDRADGLLNDFYTSPINRNILALSYLIGAWVIGFVMVMVNLVIGQVYVLSQGGELIEFGMFLKLLGLVVLSIMTFSTFFFYISLHVKTRNAYGLLATLVSTFIGFLGGIYIPIGVLGKNVQNVMNVLPTAHAVTIIRRVYMEGAINAVFANAPQEAYDTYAYWYGLDVKVGSFEFTNLHMVLSLVIFMVVFFSLSVIKLSRSKLQ
jgi:multidrug/hemolysin transport system permease protein